MSWNTLPAPINSGGRLTKQEIIAAMLRNYSEAQETLHGPDGIRGDGTSVRTMPDTWTDEYRELERCLKVLRDERPTQCWHLRERYITAHRRRIEVELLPNGQPRLPAHAELESIAPIIRGRHAIVHIRQWSPKVRAEKARKALDFIVRNYRGEPYLPAQLRHRQAA